VLIDGYLIGPEASLTYANLMGAKLEGVNLTKARLTKANLIGADLTSANLSEAELTGVSLTNATLTGVGSRSISGTPAALPTHWQLVDGALVEQHVPSKYVHI
jgi:uncharacterized protein YjbI with pentapeptide repeats